MNWNDGEGCNVEAELRERLEKCEAAIKIGRQAMAEIHFARSNPRWFTNGESAAWQHTTLWISRFLDAARAALEGPASCHEPYKSGIKTTCHKCSAYPVEQARAAVEG